SQRPGTGIVVTVVLVDGGGPVVIVVVVVGGAPGPGAVVAVVEVVAVVVVVCSGPAEPITASGRRSTKTLAASAPRYTTDWLPAVPIRPGSTMLLTAATSSRRASAPSATT